MVEILNTIGTARTQNLSFRDDAQTPIFQIPAMNTQALIWSGGERNRAVRKYLLITGSEERDITFWLFADSTVVRSSGATTGARLFFPAQAVMKATISEKPPAHLIVSRNCATI